MTEFKEYLNFIFCSEREKNRKYVHTHREEYLGTKSVVLQAFTFFFLTICYILKCIHFHLLCYHFQVLWVR